MIQAVKIYSIFFYLKNSFKGFFLPVTCYSTHKTRKPSTTPNKADLATSFDIQAVNKRDLV